MCSGRWRERHMWLFRLANYYRHCRSPIRSLIFFIVIMNITRRIQLKESSIVPDTVHFAIDIFAELQLPKCFKRRNLAEYWQTDSNIFGEFNFWRKVDKNEESEQNIPIVNQTFYRFCLAVCIFLLLFTYMCVFFKITFTYYLSYFSIKSSIILNLEYGLSSMYG